MRRTRGFTLLELMIVVVLIGVLAMLAMPSMGRARIDRHVYDDAGITADFFREARARAVGRGAAVAVFMTQVGSQATLTMAEAVTAGPAAGTLVPYSSCGGNVAWGTAAASGTLAAGQAAASTLRTLDFTQVHGFELDNKVAVTVFAPAAGGVVRSTSVGICFTPLGRAFLATVAPTTGMFTTPMSGVAIVEFARLEGGALAGIDRRVLIPPSGVTRIQSGAAVMP